VSDAIDWAPPAWTARADDVVEIARIGRTLLNDAQAPSDGLKALNHHNKAGIRAWKSYLGAPAGPCYN
jgi:hypothetical protein